MDTNDYINILNRMQIGEDRSEGGYKGLATRLSSDLGRDISPSAVKNYLKKKERTAAVKQIKHKAKRARSEGAYKYGSGGAIYKMLKGHFGEGIEYNLEDIERAELEEAVKKTPIGKRMKGRCKDCNKPLKDMAEMGRGKCAKCYNANESMTEAVKSKHPGLRGVSAKTRSETVSKAKKGEKIFGGGFKGVEKKAAEHYGSKESGKRVAAAVMWKKLHGK
jgi:phage FluMu protein Com